MDPSSLYDPVFAWQVDDLGFIVVILDSQSIIRKSFAEFFSSCLTANGIDSGESAVNRGFAAALQNKQRLTDAKVEH